MPDVSEDGLQAQLELLKSLYDRKLLTEEAYRAELAVLGVDPSTSPVQPSSEGQPQAGTTYNIHIAHAEGTAIGDEAQAAVAQSDACPPDVDDAEALDCYLRHTIEANRRLQWQGIRSAGRMVSIELERIYVTLTATERRAVEEQEAWVAEMARLSPGERQRLSGMGLEGSRERVVQVAVTAQGALAAHPRLVVLGDPGCGRTTLLRYLALTYARDLLDERDWVAERLQLDERCLPILLPLRDLSWHLEKEHPDPGLDGPKLLLDYLRTYFANQGIALPEGFFACRLQKGACAVLLDGVDEVADLRPRQRVARLIERFTIAYPDNRYVVTSRIVGYTGAARLGEGYEMTTVRDFTRADVERFVRHWNLAVELALAGQDTPYVRGEAQKKSKALLEAINTKERMRELAVNPLLLTVIALVQRYRAQLPERRTELYEEAVEVLLGKWDEAKGLETTALLRGIELDAGDRRGLLEPVALWMMEQHVHEIDADELKRQLIGQFRTMTADARQARKAVADFLNLIGERSGLLAERGIGVYAFSHLTFQEHLAARAVADLEAYVPYTLARLGDSWWREVILLEAGYLSTQGKRRVTRLIQALMDCPEEPALYHNLVLSAECLNDVGLARVEGDLWDEVLRRLRREFETPLRREGRSQEGNAELIRRRAAAAVALARIESGAPGTGPAFWRLPYGEPVWVEVPAGAFWMGSERWDHEKTVHRAHLDAFWIGQVAVTNAQYQVFVDATGHRAPRHWRDGQVPRGLEGHPVVNVTWHDALAYCRWLSEATGKAIALPSEAQWEKAARGDADRRIYPWGDTFDAARCNSRELGLGGTTPVGIFPEGASPYGCLDMAGNAWEWTRSLWGESSAKPEFKYPYDPDDGREDLDVPDDGRRVVRGGSFSNGSGNMRCAARYNLAPDLWFRYFGFRVCAVSRQE